MILYKSILGRWRASTLRHQGSCNCPLVNPQKAMAPYLDMRLQSSSSDNCGKVLVMRSPSGKHLTARRLIVTAGFLQTSRRRQRRHKRRGELRLVRSASEAGQLREGGMLEFLHYDRPFSICGAWRGGELGLDRA